MSAGIVFAQIQGPVGTVERLPNGDRLVADMAVDVINEAARAVEVDSVGQVVWAYLGSDVPLIHSAHRLANGNTLMSATGINRVLEVDPEGRLVWSLDSELTYPNDAVRVSNGNTLITDRDHDRVIEVTPDGGIIWQYDSLNLPHGGRRLANGNTLVCSSDANLVVEVDSNDKVIWEYGIGLNWPRSVQRLTNGNTVIGNSGFAWATEVTAGGRVVRVDSGPFSGAVYSAERLDNGHTLFSVDNETIELDSSGAITWRWPGGVPVRVDTLRVFNPTSGCSLYVHVHRPAAASGTHRLPGVVLVPDNLDPGTTFDLSGLADQIAADGFVALHFDADGRGQSTGPAEDYCGSVQQDGLHACLNALARRADVDTLHLGLLAMGYGITMASGTLARYPEPVVSFLIDDEGPADRYQTCTDSGGPVPVAPDSNTFWLEREAARFARQVPAAWLRFQSQTSHNPHIAGNRDCIALIDSATNVAYGGRGISRWTRVDDSVMNPSNRVYSDSSRPAVIPDVQEYHTPLRFLLYLRELVHNSFSAINEPSSALPNPGRLIPSLCVTPNPSSRFLASSVSYFLPTGCRMSLKLYDVTGKLMRVLYEGHAASGTSCLALRASHFPSGVYLVCLETSGGQVTRKLVLR